MKPAICLFLFAACALAQNDGITAHASRTVYVQPDQVEALVSLTTPATVTQQQAANVLQSAVLASRLVSASTADIGVVGRVLDRGTPSFVYTFAYSIPGADMRDVTRKLETLQNTRSSDYSSVNYSVAMTVSQALVDDQLQRVLPQMVADARKRAEVLAAAAGLKVGAVQSVSETASGPIIPAQRFAPSFSSDSAAITFSIAVKFAAN